MSGLRTALRQQLPIYGAGVFSNSNVTISSMIVPLWALYLEISPGVIGILLGIRHLPGLLFAIHGGVLLDRLGARPVMIIFAALAVVVPLLFPIMPWVWAILVLQMVWGCATTMTWMGAQTAVSQLMRGSTRHAARLSVSVRIGMIVGPPFAGLAWDIWGPWGGFGAISVWAVGLLISCWYMPTFEGGDQPPVRRFRSPVHQILSIHAGAGGTIVAGTAAGGTLLAVDPDGREETLAEVQPTQITAMARSTEAAL